MTRRAGGWIVLLALGTALSPLCAGAQPRGKPARVGVLLPHSTTDANLSYDAFRAGLRDTGYVEGRTIVFETRLAHGRFERLPALAAELASLKVDVIFAGSQPAIQAAMRATKTTPIVMIDGVDPVEAGFVQTLAQPGGNITGLSAISHQLLGRQVALLKEALPTIRRVAVLATPNSLALYSPELKRAAQSTGLEWFAVEVHPLRNTPMPVQIEDAITSAATQRADALFVLPLIFFAVRQNQIAELAKTHRLPALFWQREFALVGGFMAYGASRAEQGRRAASYVDRILKGAKPSALPVEQPTTFELIINLKTANALGLTVPAAVLLQATEVIR